MPRSCLFLCLLAALPTTRGLAQTTEEFNTERSLSIDLTPPKVTPPAQHVPAPGEITIPDSPDGIEGSDEASSTSSLRDFWGYRYEAGSLEWIPGGGDHFGMFSIVGNHYVKAGLNNNVGVGLGIHFLAGPKQTDMPPRVYDFSIGYQIRQRLGLLTFDVSTAVMASSDFEGSAREGIRFPSHAVGYLSMGPTIDAVFGVDYLDRGDIKLLPVAGLIWIPNSKMRFEIVFPRPRVFFQFAESNRLYLAGDLGGGTWAIERAAIGNDLSTYRDLSACIGVEHEEKDGQRCAFEIGYLFDRRLEFASGIGDMHLDDALMLRLVTFY